VVKFSSSEYSTDTKVSRLRARADPAKLRALIEQGIQILDRDVPSIVFSSAYIALAWWDNVQGHGAATKGANFWEGMRNETWWLAK
jgi:hypothetical protein